MFFTKKQRLQLKETKMNKTINLSKQLIPINKQDIIPEWDLVILSKFINHLRTTPRTQYKWRQESVRTGGQSYNKYVTTLDMRMLVDWYKDYYNSPEDIEKMSVVIDISILHIDASDIFYGDESMPSDTRLSKSYTLNLHQTKHSINEIMKQYRVITKDVSNPQGTYVESAIFKTLGLNVPVFDTFKELADFIYRDTPETFPLTGYLRINPNYSRYLKDVFDYQLALRGLTKLSVQTNYYNQFKEIGNHIRLDSTTLPNFISLVNTPSYFEKIFSLIEIINGNDFKVLPTDKQQDLLATYVKKIFITDYAEKVTDSEKIVTELMENLI